MKGIVYLNFAFHLRAATDIRYEVEGGEADPFDDVDIDYLTWSTPPKECAVARLDLAKVEEALVHLRDYLGIEVVSHDGPEGKSWELRFDGKVSPGVIADELTGALLPLGIDPSAALASAGNLVVRIDDKGGTVQDTVVTLWALREGLTFGKHRAILDAEEEPSKDPSAPRQETLDDALARAEAERRLQELEERARLRRESAELTEVRERLAKVEAELAAEQLRRAELEAEVEAMGSSRPVDVDQVREAERVALDELLARITADIPRERQAPVPLVYPTTRAELRAIRSERLDAILERIHAREDERRRAHVKQASGSKRDSKGRFTKKGRV